MSASMNRTLVDVPTWATALNDTCSLNDHKLSLSWTSVRDRNDSMVFSSPDAFLTMHFSSGLDPNPPMPYSEDNIWIWMSGLTLKTPQLEIVIKEVKLFQVPRFFAYACPKHSIRFLAKAQFLSNGTKVESEDVWLQFHHFKVEAFRHNRYYTEFTHLKWNCLTGWPYGLIPAIISILMLVVSILTVCPFAMRHRAWKGRNKDSIQEEQNSDQYHADDEQQLVSD